MSYVRFREGDRVRVCNGSGIDSRKTATVVAYFDWRKASDGTYRAPGSDQIPLKYDDGMLGFMYRNRLEKL